MTKKFEKRQQFRDYKAARESLLSIKNFSLVLLLVLAIAYGLCLMAH
ncbi:MAG TPA: hypothetical protein PKD05_16765 [Candidatus Melainabacteria bacterium]|nr:hypothetical protein [Candidatus Melainabacteria bacterium]